MCSLTVGNCFAAHLLRREYPVLFKIYIRILTFLSNIIDQIGRLLMWRPRPEGVKNLLNIRYGDEKWAKYDLHYQDNGRQKPLFIYIHGGGFVSGDKSVCRYYCYEYAQRGYAAMNINYQFAPEAKHPDQLRQIFSEYPDRAVLRLFRQFIPDLPLNGRRNQPAVAVGDHIL